MMGAISSFGREIIFSKYLKQRPRVLDGFYGLFEACIQICVLAIAKLAHPKVFHVPSPRYALAIQCNRSVFVYESVENPLKHLLAFRVKQLLEFSLDEMSRALNGQRHLVVWEGGAGGTRGIKL